MKQLTAILLICLSVTAVTWIGCVEGAFRVEPVQIPAEAVKLVVEEGAVQIAASAPAVEFPEKFLHFDIQPGAITVKLDAPVQNDINFPKYGILGAATLATIAAVVILTSKWSRRYGQEKEGQED